jgi:hypothetical protein
MDAAKEQPEDGELAVVTPRRYSKAQHKVNVFPFEVKRDSGEIADQGYITLNVRTGKLTIEHRLAEVPF